jgi:hypothetical protein
MNRSKISALRKNIRESHQEISPLLEVILGHSPLLKGCVYESRRRCGNPRCGCAGGQLHCSTVLAYRGLGRQRNLYPSPKEIPFLRKLTADYQRFRRSRVRLVKVFRELLETVTKMERERLAAGERRFQKTECGGKVK